MSERQAPDPMRQGPADGASEPDDALRQDPDFTFGAPQPPTGGNPGRERPTPWGDQPHQLQEQQQPQAQPYHEQPPQPGQRYSQTPVPGMPAHHPFPIGGNRRPAAATAAAVLSIVDGALGLVKAGALIFMMTVLIQASESIGSRGRSDLSFSNPASWSPYGESFITLCIALTLIVAGIRFFHGKGHTALTIASIAQLALIFCEVLLAIVQYNTLSNPPPIFAIIILIQAIGATLAALIIAFLFNKKSRMWKNTAGRQARP